MPSTSKTQHLLPKCLCAMLSGFVLASAAHADTITHTTNFEYEPVTGLLAAQVREPGNAQLNLRTQFTYGQFGNLLTTQVSSAATGLAAIPSHTVNTLQYDANGVVPINSTNALGQTLQTGFSPASLPLYQTDANGLTTTWQYDGFGRKTQELRPDGTITRWQYLLCGTAASCVGHAQYVVVTNLFAADGVTANGPWSKIYYDRLDRTVRVETVGFAGVITVDTEYDAQGRVARLSRPYYANAPIQWSVNSYDALGRIVATTSPDNSAITTAYNGLTSTVTNALNQTQTALVNSMGKVLKVTDAQNNSLSYAYDAEGNLTKTTDPKGNIVIMGYDALGRKTSMIDPDLGPHSYIYDALGRLRQQTDAKSNVTTMTYDLLGRLLNRGETDLVSTWSYDSCAMGKGRLCRATADNGYSIDYSFDAKGRPSQNVATIDTTYASGVTYDANGRVATKTYPSGLTLKHIYTPIGYLQAIHNSATNALYWQADAMDAEGRLLQQTYGNGVVTQQVFDAATGRTKNIYAGAGNAVQNLSFTYDKRGNMLTRNDANQNLAETFLYDTLNRLTSNTVNSSGAGLVTQTYAYDSIGNITNRSDVGGYTYGAINARPHAVAEIALAGGGKRQYTYDANGSLVKEEQRDSGGALIAAKGRTGTYTSFYMPATLASPAATLQFVYGSDHQRVKQITPSATTIYVHPDNIGSLLYEKDIKSDGSVEHKHYITAPGGVVAIVKQTTAGTTTLYLHRDHLGSTSAVSNETGAVIERLAYEPFGKRRTQVGATDPGNAIVGTATDRGFTNHEHLDELGLIHSNGRVYDPATGRFMSADPEVPYPTNIQSYNRYSYARNNPLVTIDPSGFIDITDDPEQMAIWTANWGVSEYAGTTGVDGWAYRTTNRVSNTSSFNGFNSATKGGQPNFSDSAPAPDLKACGQCNRNGATGLATFFEKFVNLFALRGFISNAERDAWDVGMAAATAQGDAAQNAYLGRGLPSDSTAAVVGTLGGAAVTSAASAGRGTGALLGELKANGVKFNPEGIVAIQKLADGRIVFLEVGNGKAGLTHIMRAHGDDFARAGVSPENVPKHVMDSLSRGQVVGYQGKDMGRPIYELPSGERTAITVGDNGFVVGANPAGR